MTDMLKVQTHSAEETRSLGQKLGKLLRPGDFVALTGDLGAGKTQFTQGIAAGLGVEEAAVSPTYTLINEYEGRCPVYHFDVYRLDRIDEMEDLGYEEYFYGQGVTIVEWADRIRPLLPKDYLWVEIYKLEGQEQEREFKFAARGRRSENILKELAKECTF